MAEESAEIGPPRLGFPGNSVQWRKERAADLAQIETAFTEAKRQWNTPSAHAALTTMRGLLRNADYQDWLASADPSSPPESPGAADA